MSAPGTTPDQADATRMTPQQDRGGKMTQPSMSRHRRRTSVALGAMQRLAPAKRDPSPLFARIAGLNEIRDALDCFRLGEERRVTLIGHFHNFQRCSPLPHVRNGGRR